MAGTTPAPREIPYMTGDDALASLDTWSQAMAERVDYLLGEAGTAQINMAGGTTATVNITFTRAYASPPIVTTAGSHSGHVVNLLTPTTTGCGFRATTVSGTSSSTVTVYYIVRPVS